MAAYTLPSIAIPGQRLGPISTYTSGPGTHIHAAHVCASIAGPVILEETETPAKPVPRKKQTLVVSRAATASTTGATSASAVRANAGGPTVITHVGPTQAQAGQPAAAGKHEKALKARYTTLPVVDSIILGQVTRVQRKSANLTILVVADGTLGAASDQPASTAQIASILSAAAPTTTSADNNNTNDLRFQATIRREDVRAVEKDKVVMDEMFRVGDIVRAAVISMGDQSAYYVTTARNDLGVVMARSEEGNMMFPVSWREMKDAETGRTELRKVAKPF
ncbi:exosome 3'-_5 exonuclease subunit ski4 (Csl4) [Ascosphaera acerosa]|nr:exosome 3'->5 exonuclease subunit ski4 (Csl4) [Ascosphaera acerosa]